ncbi:AraC family transcriptional regulator [Psychromonas sp. MB-3u-54]|uniref:AraC family transcriptional regulator n=1 Tax=Psychromonas sp. MB-3u-54 TaxID=2058319 RepID=UPI001E628F57|nr:AraC family transcriptional regulator [Psychromonas sp. MB-3u-54]
MLVLKPTIENVSNQLDFSWRIQRYDCCDAQFDWHYHFEYEIVLYRHLNGKLFAGDYMGEITHNNLFVFGPKLPHTAIHQAKPDNPNNSTYILWFSQQWINQLVNQFPELNNLKSLLSRSTQGLQFDELTAERVFQLVQAHQTFTPAMEFSRLIEVLVTLSEAKQVKRLNAYSLPKIEDNPKELTLVRKISDYIELNFRNHIQVIDLCNEVHVSESTIYRLFERHFVCSFSNHVKEFRIGKACELLINGNTSIAVIADLVGFTNLSNFNRQFKQCKQITPKQFRLLFA